LHDSDYNPSDFSEEDVIEGGEHSLNHQQIMPP